MLILYFVSFKGRYVFSCRGGGGRRRAEASEGRVISESEHQKGMVMLQAFSFRNVTRKCETARQLCKYSGKLRKIIAALFN